MSKMDLAEMNHNLKTMSSAVWLVCDILSNSAAFADNTKLVTSYLENHWYSIT